MSFRILHPSFGESNASTSNSSQSIAGSTRSDPRQSCSEKDAENNHNPSKRRRLPKSVTRNACLNCRKARAKCDGKRPCKRCASRAKDLECTYGVHTMHSKEELVRQINELKTKNHLTEQILRRLFTDENAPNILQRLRRGETYQSIVERLSQSTSDDSETLPPRGSHHYSSKASGYNIENTTSTTFRWTLVTSDTAVLGHLFQLYFTWIHPIHTLFSEGYFIDSYKRQSVQYCSEILVNALCAMACHLHSAVQAGEVDFEQLGEEFSDAARSSIDPKDKSVTTVQALGVIFLIDCARGKGLRASSYLNMAMKNLSSVSSQNTDGFPEVLKDTVRGIHSLNVEWAQMTFQVPATFSSSRFKDFEDLKDLDEKLDDSKWYFYRYVDDQCPAWPGLFATTNREKSKLIWIIHDVTTMMYTQQGPRITVHDILQQYIRFIAWREELPSTISNIENNSQPLPHVLSLLILYSSAVVQLLRPLLHFEGFPSPFVKEVIRDHALKGLFLLDEHYQRQYTCRYLPVLQMFAALHLVDVIARFFPSKVDGDSKDGPEAIQLGMEILMQSRAGFPVADSLQEMLRRTADECSVPLSQNLDRLIVAPRPQKHMNRMDDLIDACTRPTYVQPVDEIHMRYPSSLPTDWPSGATVLGFREPDSDALRLRVQSAEERDTQSLMQIHTVLNTD